MSGKSTSRSCFQPCWQWYLVLALVVAPLLARMHQVLHVPGHVTAHAHSTAIIGSHSGQALAATADASLNVDSTSATQALFAHHASLDCQALDQLAQGQATLLDLPWQAASGAATSPVAWPELAVHCLRRSAPVARGPPGDHSVLWF